MSKNIRPFLKWAGGKTLLVDKITHHLGEGSRLIEPFVGSGAVFLNTDFDRYLLADNNQDLIDVYNHLKNKKQQFIDSVSQYFTEKYNHADQYYAIREYFNQLPYGFERACLFVYLNRHGYNGLCRYNLKGGYNVPFGRFKRPYFPANEMVFFTEKSKKAEIVCADFRHIMRRSRAGDLIYCDPPYVPVSSTAYFTQYSRHSFTPHCQQDLVKESIKARDKGSRVVVSNHDNKITRELYQQAQLSSFYVQRNISCDGKRRKKVKELIATFDANNSV